MAKRNFTKSEEATVKDLPFPVRAYTLGDSHPFSYSSHIWYSEEDLRAIRPQKQTNRDDWFKKALYGLYLTLAGPVPYAFRDANGQVRSLDAGCLARLLKRDPSYIHLIIREQDGAVVAVEPTKAMLSASDLVPMRDRLMGWWSPQPAHMLPTVVPEGKTSPISMANRISNAKTALVSEPQRIPIIYLTKTWGFQEPVPPLLFGMKGSRDTARAVLKPGDLVAIVGTLGSQTPPHQQGRVLGLVEPTSDPVLATDFPIAHRAVDQDANGTFRWPFGLLCRNAWIIPNPPLLSQITTRRFNMDAAQGIVPLEPSEAAAIMALQREPAERLESNKTIKRIEGEDAARKRGAPPPQTTRRGVMHMRRAAAETYLLSIEGAKRNGHLAAAHKVGWAFNHAARTRVFNTAALPDLGGLRYQPVLRHEWDTAKEAYQMEQMVLRHFHDWQSPSNREVIVGVALEEIEIIWRESVARLLLKIQR